MKNRMSEGTTNFEGIFGLANTKEEEKTIKYDEATLTQEKIEETFWFETPFTKAQFQKLADLCESSSESFIRELSTDFRSRSINGYGGGL